MAGRSSKANNRGGDLFGLFVSGKSKDFHTFKSANRGSLLREYKHLVVLLMTILSVEPLIEHIFTASGSFEVSELGNLGNEIEYLVVGGRWRRWSWSLWKWNWWSRCWWFKIKHAISSLYCIYNRSKSWTIYSSSRRWRWL